MLLSRILIFFLISQLTWPQSSAGQTVGEPSLKLLLISGGEKPQIVGHRQDGEITVRVMDAQNRGVPGVAVTFQLPDQGVTGSFADGGHSLVAQTDGQGIAAVTGIQWGSIAGMVSIRATAVDGTVHAGIIVRQELASAPAPAAPGIPAPKRTTPPPLERNVEIVTARSGAIAQVPDSETPAVSIASTGKGGRGSKKWLIAVLAAGAAAGVGVALLHKKSSSTTTSSSSDSSTIGSPTINIGPP